MVTFVSQNVKLASAPAELVIKQQKELQMDVLRDLRRKLLRQVQLRTVNAFQVS